MMLFFKTTFLSFFALLVFAMSMAARAEDRYTSDERAYGEVAPEPSLRLPAPQQPPHKQSSDAGPSQHH
ncbi:unnamed protein product [Tilletia laevis]|uniref:Secreted protein n=2 Tax=Tilletia TaxID=13289 RepID=A0A177VCQ4_9BASI|nr:hypothetical protein CF336_g4089 [Tilletia laevis]KAE8197710.1 hypothetical protein CF328_g3767 [Tilletia controversa]KAE8261230.1 hypothetical protein A4X03_0g3432 [Tilletia caries]KAE8202881.1 hypothetical protein CF335_g3242 [Tilletia laevis]CAD6892436.1 unnamed protein product [Tilletia caries]